VPSSRPERLITRCAAHLFVQVRAQLLLIRCNIVHAQATQIVTRSSKPNRLGDSWRARFEPARRNPGCSVTLPQHFSVGAAR